MFLKAGEPRMRNSNSLRGWSPMLFGKESRAGLRPMTEFSSVPGVC